MIVDNAVYRHGTRLAIDCEPDDFAGVRRRCTHEGDFAWVGLHEPDSEELAALAEAFGLHELAIEDALKAHQRPKLERYGDTLFVVLKTLWYIDADDQVETGEIAVFLGSDFLVTVRHGEGSQLHASRLSIEERGVLEHGPSAALYAVCDSVVDGYESVAAALEEDVDEVETSVFSPGRSNDSERMYTLKREIAEVRRAVLPLRDPVDRFARAGLPLVEEALTPFFRDVADHLARVALTIDGLDGLLSTAFDAHLAQISVQQNEDMRKISAGVALAVVPTLIAGVYGMNFDVMPELHWTWGYLWAIGLMVGCSTALWVFFKRSGWL